MALALAALHNFDEEGISSVAHSDIGPSQFVRTNGRYQLNDFNRARLLRRNVSNNSTCGFFVGSNPGKNRAPEEYAYEAENEKIDVYSMGNIFYMLLQEEWPFQGVNVEEAQKQVMEGVRPTFYKDIWDSTHPIDVALKEAMMMCHAQKPSERATARQVEQYLIAVLEKVDPGRLAQWQAGA
jgi:serine/threonine protein kinase